MAYCSRCIQCNRRCYGVLCASCRGVEKKDNNLEPKRMPEPTDAQPGSEEKVLILIARVERRESLWHPEDRGVKDKVLPPTWDWANRFCYVPPSEEEEAA